MFPILAYIILLKKIDALGFGSIHRIQSQTKTTYIPTQVLSVLVIDKLQKISPKRNLKLLFLSL